MRAEKISFSMDNNINLCMHLIFAECPYKFIFQFFKTLALKSSLSQEIQLKKGFGKMQGWTFCKYLEYLFSMVQQLHSQERLGFQRQNATIRPILLDFQAFGN